MIEPYPAGPLGDSHTRHAGTNLKEIARPVNSRAYPNAPHKRILRPLPDAERRREVVRQVGGDQADLTEGVAGQVAGQAVQVGAELGRGERLQALAEQGGD